MGVSFQDANFLLENFPLDVPYLVDKVMELWTTRRADEKITLAEVIRISDGAKYKGGANAFKKWLASVQDTIKNKGKKVPQETVFQRIKANQTVFDRLKNRRKQKWLSKRDQ
jgi:ppGpp synthetase/RelA/SpoT-type nucleotidyltranferase